MTRCAPGERGAGARQARDQNIRPREQLRLQILQAAADGRGVRGEDFVVGHGGRERPLLALNSERDGSFDALGAEAINDGVIEGTDAGTQRYDFERSLRLKAFAQACLAGCLCDVVAMNANDDATAAVVDASALPGTCDVVDRIA